jgi:hypothetical protein
MPAGLPGRQSAGGSSGGTGNRFLADLDSSAFGYSWAGFAEEGGDIRPFIPQALNHVSGARRW